MRRSGAIALFSVLVVATVAACLTTSGLSDGESPNENDSGLGADATTDDGSATDGSATDSGFDADAGPSRDFSTDASLFFGDSRCADAGVQLCEDFETGTLDTSTWTIVGTAPTIDGTEHARGSKALHVLITGKGASMIRETKTFPEVGDTYWGRVFVYFHQLPHEIAADGGMPYSHWTFAYGAGTGDPGQIRVSGQLQLKGAKYINLFGVGTDDGVPIPSDAGTGDWTLSDNDPDGGPMTVPASSWQCIEWLHDGTNQVTRFFWNDTEHPSLMTTETKHGGNPVDYVLPAFTSVTIGWQEYQTSVETFEMWVDEIAIDSNRIGCVL